MNLIYALLAGILPTLLWLWFWLREDNLHPEPRSIISIAFIIGIITVPIAIVLETFASELIINESYKYIAWASIEEICKIIAVLFIIYKSKYIDEPIDIMIYCITVALGFSALENTLFIFSPIQDGDILKGIITGNMRFIGATLVHVVCTSLIGFMLGLAFYKKKYIKFIAGIVGVILAIILHASFNLSIINETVTNTLKVFGFVWLSVVILIILFEEIKDINNKTSTS